MSSDRRSRLPAVAALLFATSSWGGLFIIAKPILAVLDPVWFTALRYALAALLLIGLVSRHGRSPWLKLRAHATRLTLLGLAGYGWFGAFVFVGLAHSLPSHGAVIMATMPLTALALRAWLDGVRPAPRALWGAMLAILGVATVAGLFGSGAVNAQMLAGDAATLVGTFGWVLYTRGAAALPDHSPLEYTTLTAVVCAPWLLLGAAIASWLGLVPQPTVPLLVHLGPSLLLVAIVPTVLAALAFNFGVQRVGAPTGTLFMNVVPVSVLAVHAVLGAPIQPAEIGGAVLVALALWLNASASAAAQEARNASRLEHSTATCQDHSSATHDGSRMPAPFHRMAVDSERLDSQ